MSCAGKTTLAAEVQAVVAGAGRSVVQVAYDDFHQPRERRYRLGRMSAEGYLDDAFDPAALRRLVLDPLAAGEPAVVPAAYDLAGDKPVEADPVPVAAGSVVLVDGSFLLVPRARRLLGPLRAQWWPTRSGCSSAACSVTQTSASRSNLSADRSLRPRSRCRPGRLLGSDVSPMIVQAADIYLDLPLTCLGMWGMVMLLERRFTLSWG